MAQAIITFHLDCRLHFEEKVLGKKITPCTVVVVCGLITGGGGSHEPLLRLARLTLCTLVIMTNKRCFHENEMVFSIHMISATYVSII